MTTKAKENSPEALLEKMRAGYKLPLVLKYNGLEVQARLLPGEELANAISNAKSQLKIPDGHTGDLLESQAVMKAVLKAATHVDNTPQLGDKFLNMLTNEELVNLHDQYESLVKTVNPSINELGDAEIAEIIGEIKKKDAKANDYYMWQLAAIGRYFLDRLQATGNGLGGG